MSAVVTVNESDTRGSATAGIQEAIDALPADGGVIHLPSGRYNLRRSVELRSNVRLCGEGPATVLTRSMPIVTVPVTQSTDGSQLSLHVACTDGLQTGDDEADNEAAMRRFLGKDGNAG